jgi:hypothetical protein
MDHTSLISGPGLIPVQGDTFSPGEISSIQTYFGKRRGSGSEQVAIIRELQLIFFAISDFQGFQAKLAYLRAGKITLTDPFGWRNSCFMGWR